MTTTPSREDWEKEFDDRFDWICEYIAESYEEDPMKCISYQDIKSAIRDILQNNNNALVAEIEELKEQRNEIYKMTVEHFSNEQEKVSFFKKFVDIIRTIQEK